jgi:voltage-gated potassium channel
MVRVSSYPSILARTEGPGPSGWGRYRDLFPRRTSYRPDRPAHHRAGSGDEHDDAMTTQRVRDRSGVVRRRAVRRMLVRGLLTSAALVVLYYKVPTTGALDASAIARLVVGLLVFAMLIVWQVRAILRSEFPGLRAVEALAAAIPLFLLLFASAYLTMADAQAGAFTEPLTKTNALYFTVTVFATVGFGDIAPKTEAARVATMVQMMGDLVVVGLVVRVMVGAAKVGREQRSAEAGARAASAEPASGDPTS